MNNNHFIIILAIIIMAYNVYARFPDFGYDDKVRIWEPVAEQNVLERLYEFIS